MTSASMAHRQGRRPYWPGVAFVVITVQLLLWNVYALDRNQETFTVHDSFRVRPRNIGAAAAANKMDVIRHTFATYHRMRALLAGKTLVVPERVAARHGFFLERVARVKVEESKTALILPMAHTDLMFGHEDRFWNLGENIPLLIFLDPRVDRYLLVVRDDWRALYLLSEERYQLERQAADDESAARAAAAEEDALAAGAMPWDELRP